MLETEIVFSYLVSPEDGYEAHALDHSIFAQADTIDELKTVARNAVRDFFDDARAHSEIRLVQIPKPRWLGSAKGEFTVPDDFNDPLPKEIEDLFW